MERAIMIGDKAVVLSNSSRALVYYREQFGREYFDELKAAETVEGFKKTIRLECIGFQILWAMAKAADCTISPPNQWMRELGKISVKRAVAEAERMIYEGMETHSKSEGGEKKPYKTENLISACIACGLSVDWALNMPLGMLIDILNEYANSRKAGADEKGKDTLREATQADYDDF